MGGPSTTDATSSLTVKFFCSYGGRITPRHPDGKLRYHGGHTRILAVHRSIPFSELLLKLREFCGTTVRVRCQLPTEDLDALVSITCDEDLTNIIEEYDRLLSPPCPLKIRAFLSPPKSLRKPAAAAAAMPSASPRLSSSASSKSSTSTSSSSSSSRTLSAASVTAVASCCSARSHKYAMMPMVGDCCIQQKVLPQSFPMVLEKPKGKISNHHPVPRPQCCYHGQRHVNAPHYYLIHNGYHWQ